MSIVGLLVRVKITSMVADIPLKEKSMSEFFFFFTMEKVRGETASRAPDSLGDDPSLDFADKLYLNMKPFVTVL